MNCFNKFSPVWNNFDLLTPNKIQHDSSGNNFNEMCELPGGHSCGNKNMQTLLCSSAKKIRLNKKLEKFEKKKKAWVQRNKKNLTASHILDQASVLKRIYWRTSVIQPKVQLAEQSHKCIDRMKALFEVVIEAPMKRSKKTSPKMSSEGTTDGGEVDFLPVWPGAICWFRRRHQIVHKVCKLLTLDVFWGQIEPALPLMKRIKATPEQDVCHAVTTSLQPIDEFFLFLNYLSLVLGAVGIWLDEDTVKQNMPEVFSSYTDTHVILDCTELRCQTPDSPLLQNKECSSYKSHSTFKGLIGMAPHGYVTFISSLYEGCISHREILKQSGLVSLLKPSMAIMVDKSFLVEDLVPCKVYIPACLKKSQLSGAEVRKTQSTARLRAHVERVVRRVKELKLFRTQIPLSLTGSINQLFAVACLLVNYQNRPLVKA
ncbi:hypothetical protein WMY93_031328 [Mugilogobius chulae]|uniref:DDE Tnp4 domain-containing protein n=1 Tax=Mugilogobius chulae TaxID=88201 RepID=A0AAW0MEC8_9GOBI